MSGSPCYLCPNRSEECHGDCAPYLAFAEKRRKENEAKRYIPNGSTKKEKMIIDRMKKDARRH